MNTPNLIGLAVGLGLFLLLQDDPKPEHDAINRAYLEYYDQSTPLHLVFSAGWQTLNNDCPTNFTVISIFAPRVTFDGEYYTIEFQE